LISLALIYHGCQQKEDFSYRCNRTTRWCASRLLLQKKHEVYALIRSTKSESPKAQNLRNQGAKLVEADLDKPDSLEQVMNGIDSVFLMGTWVEVGTEGEIRRGKMMVDIAKEKKLDIRYTSLFELHKISIDSSSRKRY